MAGALLVLGISLAFTIETWWLAVEIPVTHLVGFVVGGLVFVFPVTRTVGFRSDEADTGPRRSPVWVEFFEAVFQGFFVAYVVLFLLGVLSPQDPLPVIVRTGLVQIVPLTFGATLANEVLRGDQDEIPEASFPRSLGVFTMGAVFFAAPIAPTDEVAVLVARADWPRLGVILLVTLVVTYLILYELEFRGQTARLEGRSRWRQIGQTCTLYAVGLVVAAGLLVAMGDAVDEPVATLVGRTIVLAFPAAIGASAARVVLA